MKLTLDQFLSRYAASGLRRPGSPNSSAAAPADAAAEPLSAFAAEHEGRQPADVQELARWMISRRWLTRYQTQQLIAARPDDLRVGPFIVRQPIAAAPLVGWFAAIAEDGSPVLLLRRPRRETAAVLRRVDMHVAVRSPYLQRIDPPVVTPEATLYVSHLPAGTTAAQATPRGGFSTARVARLGRQLCEAVTALHDHGLPATITDPTRVWIAKTGDAVLLRDPLSDHAPSGDHDSGRAGRDGTSADADGAGWFTAPAVPNLFLAPERQLDGRGADPSSDLYAVGCLLFFLRFGHPPFAGTTPAALAEQHAKQFPSAIRAALATPESAEPLLRVIGHAMAKNCDARFADAGRMGLALAAVEAAAASGEAAPAARRVSAPAATERSETASPSKEAAPSAAAPPAALSPSQPPAPVEVPAPPATEGTAEAFPPVGALEVPRAPETFPAEHIAAVLPSAPAGTSRPASPPVSVARRRRKKNLAVPLILGGLGVLVMFLLILLIAGRQGEPTANRRDEQARPPLPRVDQLAEGQRRQEASNTTRGAASPTVGQPPAGSAIGGSEETAVQLVDDSRLLWAAPSSGTAPDLSLLPPGAAMIVTFRPDSLMTTAGKQLSEAFSPELSGGLQILESRIGVPLRDVERLTLAVEGAGGGATSAAVAVTLFRPVAMDVLREVWQASESQTAEGYRVYTKTDPEDDVYYVPPPESSPSGGPETLRFAVGSAEQMGRVAEIEGGPLPLPQNLNQLWRGIGSNPDLALLVHPNFLFADGRQMLQRYAPAAVNPLRELLVPRAAALALRMDLDPQWYVELRLAPGGGISPAALAHEVRTAVAKLSPAAEQFLLTASPHPSWRAVALRLPSMLRAVDDATRSGVVDGNAVLNLYLPPVAAPNVLLGSWLALNTASPLESPPPVAATVAATPAEPEGPRTIDQLLDRPLSIRFDQESLESAAETIREQFNASVPDGSPPLEIVLLGRDLQLAGITQNQQIRDFEHRDQPLRSVLDDLVRRANPDQTATALSQSSQKLVWALGPHPDEPGRRVVLLTTRDQAVKKYDLPPQFQP